MYLLFCVGAVAFGLSLGVQQRFFYMLPVMPALCLLAACGQKGDLYLPDESDKKQDFVAH